MDYGGQVLGLPQRKSFVNERKNIPVFSNFCARRSSGKKPPKNLRKDIMSTFAAQDILQKQAAQQDCA